MGDSRLWERPLDREFRDNMIASGNDDLDARVTILKENGNFKNVDTAIPVTSLEELEQYRSDRLTESNRDMNSIGAPSRMTVLLMTEIPFRIKILIHGCNMNFLTYGLQIA